MNSPPSAEIAMRGPAVADYPSGARMRRRAIDDFEFVWMLRGEAVFVTDHEEVPLLPGHLLLVPPGVRHSFTWDQRRPSRHGYVHFHPEHVPEHAPEHAPAREVAAVRIRRLTEHDPLAGLCAYMLWLGREQPEGWERAVNRAVALALSLFTSGPLPGDDVRATLPAPLSALIDHLRREWSQMPLRRVGVDELASGARVSRSYLNRLFQAEFGIGVAAGVESARCSRAETLLTRTDMSIGSIAYQCGFSDLFHFSHRFGRRYGMPPSAYRNAGAPPVSVLDHPGVRRFVHALWS